jgi:hypothetical protein
MFAAPVPDPTMLLGLLAQATGEFVATLEATLDVSRGSGGDRFTTRSLTRRLRTERHVHSTLTQYATTLAGRPATLHS